MKKTYWWRVVVFLIGAIGVASGYILFYSNKYNVCFLFEKKCVFNQLRKIFAEPLFLTATSLLVISLFLFLITDNVFKKWLRFAIFWFIVDIILIIIAPTYTEGWMNFGPTKESVSILMGVLFVIISLVLIIWQSVKEKTNKKSGE